MEKQTEEDAEGEEFGHDILDGIHDDGDNETPFEKRERLDVIKREQNEKLIKKLKEELLAMTKEASRIKKENVRLKDSISTHQYINEKLINSLQKKNKYNKSEFETE